MESMSIVFPFATRDLSFLYSIMKVLGKIAERLLGFRWGEEIAVDRLQMTLSKRRMAPNRCAHLLSTNKKLERIQNLVGFAKKASQEEITNRLLDVWSSPECSITDVRILFVLGADPEALYSSGYGEKALTNREEIGTVCDICAKKYREFLQFARLIYSAQFHSKPFPIKKPKRNGQSARNLITLALDGGGMRGLVSISCLLFASRRLLGNESLPKLVDWYVGCSTGSMLALALAKGNSLTDCFFLYWEMKNEIFLDKSTMKRLFGNVVDKQTARVESVLEKVFDNQKDTFMKSSHRLTVPSLDVATTPGKLHTFRNYPTRDRPIEEVTFRDAARASSAAPTYFHPHLMNDRKLVDGSLVANCPLGILFGEYDKCIQNGEDISMAMVLSVGTGEPRETKRRYQSGSSIGHRSRHLRDMAVLFMEQVVGHEKSVVQCAEDRCMASAIPFIRICPIGIDVRIDQIDDGKLMDMIWETLLYLMRNLDLIDRLGDALVESCAKVSASDGSDRRRVASAGPSGRQRRQTTSS